MRQSILRLRKGNTSGEGALMCTCAVYCSDYVCSPAMAWKSLNLYFFDSGVWEFDVPWVINWWELWWPRGAHEDWDTPDMSPISLWKVPAAKNPRVVRTWTCGGIGFDRRVPFWSCGIGFDRRVPFWSCGLSTLHICSSTVLGDLNHDVSHSSVSASISTCSRNTHSLPRAYVLRHPKVASQPWPNWLHFPLTLFFTE